MTKLRKVTLSICVLTASFQHNVAHAAWTRWGVVRECEQNCNMFCENLEGQCQQHCNTAQAACTDSCRAIGWGSEFERRMQLLEAHLDRLLQCIQAM